MNALPWTYICEVCNATRMLQICNLYIRRFLQYRDVIDSKDHYQCTLDKSDCHCECVSFLLKAVKLRKASDIP